MRRSLALVLVAFSLFAALPAFAIRLGDPTTIIPVIGRFPGAGGTQWRTDVFIGNRSGDAKTATLTLYVSGGATLTHPVFMPAYSVESFPDIVLNTFGLTTAAGELEVKSSDTGAIDARARIYNAGNPAGEFGQNVPGIGLSYLSRQAYIFGGSGINNNRLNIGVTNPNSVAVDVSLIIQDKNNVPLHSRNFTLQPHQNIQFNDIFTTFAITPQANVQFQFNTFELPLYGYASEVRNDTGDAIFIFGTSPNS